MHTRPILKSIFEPFNDGQKCFYIGCIAGPHFATDRLALIIDNGSDDHLNQIGPMVFTKASLSDAVTTATLKVDRGGIEENQIKIREQIPAMGEDKLLNKVLIATGCKWGCPILVFQNFTQKSPWPGKGGEDPTLQCR